MSEDTLIDQDLLEWQQKALRIARGYEAPETLRQRITCLLYTSPSPRD